MQETREIVLGDVTVARVEEMHGPIMPTDHFFPAMPGGLAGAPWLAGARPLGRRRRHGDAAMQTWVVRSGGRTILIDTGIGNDKARPAVEAWDHLSLDYLGNLARAAYGPRTSTW